MHLGPATVSCHGKDDPVVLLTAAGNFLAVGVQVDDASEIIVEPYQHAATEFVVTVLETPNGPVALTPTELTMHTADLDILRASSEIETWATELEVICSDTTWPAAACVPVLVGLLKARLGTQIFPAICLWMDPLQLPVAGVRIDVQVGLEMQQKASAEVESLPVISPCSSPALCEIAYANALRRYMPMEDYLPTGICS